VTLARKSYVSRAPSRKDWTGIWGFCPLCGSTMDHVLEGGRKCYECPDCIERFGERQLELFG